MVPAVLNLKQRCELERARQWYKFCRNVAQMLAAMLLVLWAMLLVGFIDS